MPFLLPKMAAIYTQTCAGISNLFQTLGASLVHIGEDVRYYVRYPDFSHQIFCSQVADCLTFKGPLPDSLLSLKFIWGKDKYDLNHCFNIDDTVFEFIDEMFTGPWRYEENRLNILHVARRSDIAMLKLVFPSVES